MVYQTARYSQPGDESDINDTHRETKTIRMLGVDVNPIAMNELLEQIQDGVAANDGRVIAHHNLHSLYLVRQNAAFCRFYQARVNVAPVDGMPLIWMARLYGHRLCPTRRLTYLDFVPSMMEIASANNWRVFYLGSTPSVCALGTQALVSRYPGIQLRSVNGYFDVSPSGAANRGILEVINAFQPNLLMVGMGMPRQELWIAENWQNLRAGVILPCGAAIDYIAGSVPTPPRWSGRLGLEWLFRFWAEPRRLAARYFLEPWFVLGWLAIDLINRR